MRDQNIYDTEDFLFIDEVLIMSLQQLPIHVEKSRKDDSCDLLKLRGCQTSRRSSWTDEICDKLFVVMDRIDVARIFSWWYTFSSKKLTTFFSRRP